MKTRAVSMVLLMIASALAGCTSGDPDGDGEMGIDTDVLNQMIEDNLQDFINNSSVTVHQEIHYHNNTTVVNNYDETNNEYLNTTNVEGQDVTNHYANNYSYGGIGGGNGSASNLYLLDIQFNLSTLMPEGIEVIDYRNNTIDYQYQYYDYLTNSERTDTFTIQCSDYYLIGSQSNNSSLEVSYWQDEDNYWDAWVDQYNQTIANMLRAASSSSAVREVCDEDYNTGSGDYDDLLLFEIPIPAGVAIRGDLDDGQNEYVWWYADAYRRENWNGDEYVYNLEIRDDDLEWRSYYYPVENSNNNWGAFSVGYEFETMEFHYHSMGLTGGDEDSLLSVYVSNIFPGYEYRLVVYFEMSNVVPLE